MEKNETIGKFLTKARNKKKLSLDDVIQQTKINVNVLRALESDELEKLPSKTYVRGFVLSYAKTVGIDQEKALSILNHTYEQQNPQPIQEEVQQQVTTPSPSYQNNKDTEEIRETVTSILSSLIKKQVVYSLIAVGILYAIGNGIYSFFSQLTQESQSIVEAKQISNEIKAADKNLFDIKATQKLKTIASVESKPKENIEKPKDEATNKPVVKAEPKNIEKKIEEQKPVETAAIAPEIKKATEEVKKVEEEKKEVAKEAQEERPVKVVQNLNGKFPFKEFYPTPTNMYDIVDNAPEANDKGLLPENIKASMIPDKQNVYIVATDDNTWISYKVDDQKIKRYVLKKGRRVLIKGDQILLFMGNYNATKVFLNNKLVTAQTKTGVKSMIFPEEKAKEFELPLFPSFNGIPYSAEEYKANMAQKEPLKINR